MKTKYILVLFFSILLLSNVKEAKSQFVTGTQIIGSGSNQLDISVSVDSSFNIIKFVITGPSTKWFGFSFNSTSMSPGTYTILANINGGNPAEYVMVQHAAPTLQPTQNLQNFTSSTNAGRKTFTFYRSISTADANDYQFSYMSNNLDIAWAYGSGLTLSQHQDRGSSSVNFSNPCTTVNPTILTTVNICQGDSAMIFGQYKKIAGTYSKIIEKQLACDSIVKQTLIVNTPVTTLLSPISICNGDSVLIFGQYRKIAASYYDTLQSVNSCDSILKQILFVGNSIVNTLPSINICNGDSTMIFGTYHNSSGMYADTLISMSGCDSIVKIDLNVISIDTAVVFNSDSLKAVQGADSYQWYDCATNQLIVGATDYYYFNTISGNYKVKITKGNCESFSGCHEYIATSINNISKNDTRLLIQPNPATDKVKLSHYGLAAFSSIDIYDITGKMIIRHSIQNKSNSETIDVSMLKTGIYFIKLSNNEQSITKKLIIN